MRAEAKQLQRCSSHSSDPSAAGTSGRYRWISNGGWEATIAAHCPNAAICADPFHVIQLAGRALDELRRDQWQRLRDRDPEAARWLKGTRFLLRRRAESLSPGARSVT
jgi:Transposase